MSIFIIIIVIVKEQTFAHSCSKFVDSYKEIPLLDFMVQIAESLIGKGRSKAKVKRRPSTGPASKRVRTMQNVGDHLPVEGPSRRRCFSCATKGKEKRTTTMCEACNKPLCKLCFTPFHK